MTEYKTLNVEEPIDLIKLSLNDSVYIKCRHNRELKGKLHAFDNHLNMILSEVEETYMEEELDKISNKSVLKEKNRKSPMLYIRGDNIILFSPSLRSLN